MALLWIPLFLAIGAGIFYRGWMALKTGEMQGKYGMTYRGGVAKSLGWMMVLLGPFVAIIGFVAAFR